MVIWEAEVRITLEEDCINYESEEILLLGKDWQFSSRMVRININVVLLMIENIWPSILQKSILLALFLCS